MSKYVPLYKCLVCGKIARKADYHEPLELEKHQAEVLTQGLADSYYDHSKSREKIPNAGYHDCFENGKNIGAAIFAGFVMVDETKEKDDNV